MIKNVSLGEEIVITTRNKVGLLADISYLLGHAKVNIEAISVSVAGGKAFINIGVRVLTRDRFQKQS